MAIQLSTLVRNARLDAIETQIGTAPVIGIRTGAMPADCATAATGNVLVQQALPSDWLAAAASTRKYHAFASLSELIAARTGGKGQDLWFQKTGVTVTAIGGSEDLWTATGQPTAGAASVLVGATLARTVGELLLTSDATNDSPLPETPVTTVGSSGQYARRRKPVFTGVTEGEVRIEVTGRAMIVEGARDRLEISTVTVTESPAQIAAARRARTLRVLALAA